ncbi:MAG TPA: hypothetical protein DIW52_13465 [Pseudomonas sp.]|jgi:hypothetical protein|nr:hypothetical protein [Pseudomonas sp.]
MASSFKEQHLTAEQVRDRYRKKFNKAADPLVGATIVDAIPGDADGLMPIDKIHAPLKVEIPLWSDRTEIPVIPDTLILQYWHSGLPLPVPIGLPEEFPSTVPPSAFPLEREIPLEIFQSFEGTFQFGYRVAGWNGGEREANAPITIDRTGPVRPGAPVTIDVVEPLITDAVLTRDDGVKCVIPDFIEDKKEFVRVAVGWMATLPEDEADFPDLVAFYDLLPTSREILIPKKFVTDIGSRTQYVVYFLFDKAGNRSEMSLPKSVQVALGVLPSVLQPCTVPLADDGLIDRADAALPTTVHIEPYTGWDRDDGIVILWGTKTLARTSVSAHLPFPLKINIPWSHMGEEYDFTSGTNVQPVDVDYTVFRGDYPTASPNKIIVNTDFAVAGPENPNPEPINPDLELIRFESSEGSDSELTPDDIGNPATGHIKLFDTPAPVVGDILTLWYNGRAVSSAPYVIQTGDAPGKEIPMVIPWVDIERTLVMDDLPMYYTLTRPGFNNPQESGRTTINVVLETVDLPEPTFPGAVINCTHLREKESGNWGFYVHIPTSPYLTDGVEVTLQWQSYAVDNVTELPDTDHDEQIEVTSDQERDGIDWFIPNDRCLMPTYRPPISSAGIGKVQYSITVRGTPVWSDLAAVYIGVFEEYPAGSGNAHCKLTRPPRT